MTDSIIALISRPIPPPRAYSMPERLRSCSQEGQDFWERHGPLLRNAWSEYPQLDPQLYTMDGNFERNFLMPDFLHAAASLRNGKYCGYDHSGAGADVWCTLVMDSMI